MYNLKEKKILPKINILWFVPFLVIIVFLSYINTTQKTEYSKIFKEYEDINAENTFFNSNIVFCLENGTCYHMHTCKHIKDKFFYAYDVKTATYLGFFRCKDCHPPKGPVYLGEHLSLEDRMAKKIDLLK